MDHNRLPEDAAKAMRQMYRCMGLIQSLQSCKFVMPETVERTAVSGIVGF